MVPEVLRRRKLPVTCAGKMMDISMSPHLSVSCIRFQANCATGMVLLAIFSEKFGFLKRCVAELALAHVGFECVVF